MNTHFLTFADIITLKLALTGLTDTYRRDLMLMTTGDLAKRLAEMSGLSADKSASAALHIRAKADPAFATIYAAEREALSLPPVVTAWTKANPPKTPFDLVNPKREPGWIEEYQIACDEVPNALSHEQVNDAAITMAVRIALNIGGYEDTGAPGALINDPVLGFLTEAVKASLLTARPDWYTADGLIIAVLPEGVNPKSLDDIKADQQAEVSAKRAAERKATREILKVAKDAATAAFINGLTGQFAHLADNIDAAASGLATSFGAASTITRGEGSWLTSTLTDAVAAVVAGLVNPPEGALEIATEHVQQLVMHALAKQRPTWTRRLVNGHLMLKPSEPVDAPVDPSYISRKQRSMQRSMHTFITSYGAEELIVAVKAVLPEYPEQTVGARHVGLDKAESGEPTAPAAPALV